MMRALGDIYEANGHTIQVDGIDNRYVYFAKYKAHIGERGTVDNFRGFWKMPRRQFEEKLIIEAAKKA